MRGLATFLTFLMLTSVLAGCVGVDDDLDPQSVGAPDAADLAWADELSVPRFDRILHEDVDLRAHDNLQLHVDVFRPDVKKAAEGGDGNASAHEAPVILVYSPYFELSKDDRGKPGGFLGELVDHFAPRGYAVAFADVRGTRESGGCMNVAGPKEVADGARVVEHLAHQPWSNGKVGMFGVSYPARTQLGIATLDPDGLATIVPVAGISDYYTYFYFDGVPREGNNPGTMAGYHGISAIPHASEEGVTSYPQRFGCVPENMEAGLDLSGEWNGFWADRNYNARAGNVTAATWIVHGFEDWNVVPTSAVEYFGLVDAPKRAWFLQMEHNYPQWNTFEPAWSRSDFMLQLHRWFDHWLLGIDTGVMDEPAVEVQDSSGRWRAEEAWPPENTTAARFHLTSAGTLSPDDPGEVGARSYVAAPDAWPFVDARLVYESDPLQEPLHLAGTPQLHLNLSHDRGSTHVAWHLEAVAPSGETVLLTRGYLDTLYRHGVEEGPEPMTPGEVTPLTLRAYPQDDVVPVGWKLRVVVQPDDPHVFHDTSDTASALVALHHGLDEGSALVLPTVTPPPSAFFMPPTTEGSS